MLIVLHHKPGEIKCQCCGTEMPQGGETLRPMQWFRRDWTCRHGATWTCRKCYDAGHQACPKCGCGEEYT